MQTDRKRNNLRRGPISDFRGQRYPIISIQFRPGTSGFGVFRGTELKIIAGLRFPEPGVEVLADFDSREEKAVSAKLTI
jgi:hypothetical protein